MSLTQRQPRKDFRALADPESAPRPPPTWPKVPVTGSAPGFKPKVVMPDLQTKSQWNGRKAWAPDRRGGGVTYRLTAHVHPITFALLPEVMQGKEHAFSSFPFYNVFKGFYKKLGK